MNSPKWKSWMLLPLFAFLLCRVCRAQEYPEYIERVLAGPEASLQIKAQVDAAQETYLQGKLRLVEIKEDLPTRLYGDREKWERVPEDEFEIRWQYGEELVYASSSPGSFHFAVGANDSDEITRILSAEEVKTAGEVLAQTELPLEARFGMDMSESYGVPEQNSIMYYGIYCLLNGTRICRKSSAADMLPSSGGLTMADGKLVSLTVNNVVEIEESEEAELLPIEDVIDKLAMYVEMGIVLPPYSKEAVNRIELQYYTEVVEEQLCFFPVWVFEIPAEEDGWSDIICADARTGEILFAREG